MLITKAALAVMFALAISVVAVAGVAQAAKKGPGKCGTMMYWDKKTKHCISKG
jgi:hypothetical protein